VSAGLAYADVAKLPTMRAVEATSFAFRDDRTTVGSIVVRTVIESDPDMSVFDEEPDLVGTFGSWIVRRGERPYPFDGRARILAVGRGYHRCWWQPPADVRTNEAVADLFAYVKRMADDGYSILCVIVSDADGVEIGREYLGAMDHDYGADVSTEVHDMVSTILGCAWR
jgi:hypothetical protein